MAEGGGHDWTQEYYPIAWLPYHVRKEIADFLDAGSPSGQRGFEMFASLLGFNSLEINNLRVRGAHRDFSYSPTIALFVEMETSTSRCRYCIQQVYHVLLRMRSGAVDVITKWLPEILRNHTRAGQQDIEPSLCICEQCQMRQVLSQSSVGYYPRRPNTLGNELEEQTLQPSNSSRNTVSNRTLYIQPRQPDPRHPQSQPRMERIFERPGVGQPTINEAVNSGLLEPQQNSISIRQNHSSSVYTSERIPYSNQQHDSVRGNSTVWLPPESLDLPTSSSHVRTSGSDVEHPVTSLVAQSVNASNPVGSATANVSRARISNDHEKTDNIGNCCEECRLASDSDQTAVLRPYSEPKNSCALHSNSQENPVKHYNSSVYGIRTQNSHEGASVGENINGSLGINWRNLNLDSVNGQQSQYGHHSVNDAISVNSQINRVDIHNSSVNSQINRGGDIHNQQDGDEGETVPKTMDSIPRYDGFTNRPMANYHSDQDQTQAKTNLINDETEKFERLTLSCPECEKENSCLQRKELKTTTNTCGNSNSLVTQAQPSGNGSRNSYISPYKDCTGKINQTLNCHLCQQAAVFSGQSRHVADQQTQKGKQTGNSGRQSQNILNARKEDRHSWPDGELINQIGSSGSLSSSSSDSSVRITQTDISKASCQSSRSADSRSSVVVLVTFSVGNDQARNKTHMDEVLILIRLLEKANIRVRVDMDHPTFIRRGWNRMDWLDRVLKRANFIIACITPEYAQDIEPNDGAVAHVNQLNARYIYDHMRKEFYNNQARNRRIIPVLFPSSGAVYDHVPQCMNATSVYTFSQDLEDIIKLIKSSTLKHQKSRKES